MGSNHGFLREGANADSPAQVGSGFRFDGVNDYVEIPDAPELHPAQLTIQTWVHLDALESPTSSAQYGEQWLLQKKNNRDDKDCAWCLASFRQGASHVFQFIMNAATGEDAQLIATTEIATNQWYLLTATYDQQFARFYVNGRLEAERPTTFSLDYDNTPLILGDTVRMVLETDSNLIGMLDEVLLFNRALSANEIAASYAVGSVGMCKPGPQLLRNPSFETASVLATGQGFLPDEWLNYALAVPGADTWSEDGSFGLAPGFFSQFIGASAADGIRWVAGAEYGDGGYEGMVQILDRSLAPGEQYTVRGKLRLTTRPDDGARGGYDVFLAQDGRVDAPVMPLKIGTLAAATSSAEWQERSFVFIAPANAASLTNIIFRPFTEQPGHNSYIGLDDLLLARQQDNPVGITSPQLVVTTPANQSSAPAGTTLLNGYALANTTGQLPSQPGNTNGPEIFFGEDVSPYPVDGQNQVPRLMIPKSLQANREFLARLQGVTTESFEAFPPDSQPTTLTFGTTTASLTGTARVFEVLQATNTIDGGFPITGIHGLGIDPSQLFRVSFSTPQAAFGFFVNDVEVNRFGLVLIRADGSRRPVSIPYTLPQGSGGSFYYGIIDRNDPFTAVEFQNIGGRDDGFGFDDLTIGTPEQVLPPSVANRITLVTVNGAPVDALDAAGNFFSAVEVRPGQNTFEVVATDALGLSTASTVTVFGTTCPQNFSSLGEVSASVLPEYGRTSFNEWTRVLYADLALRNVGGYPMRAPFYVGVTHISEPSVRLISSDGVSADGIPYYDYSATLTTESLITGSLTASRALAFHNPNHVQFTYDLVVLGRLNQAPAFTTAPPLEAIVGHPYAYDFNATDPDGDTLTYSLLEAPAGMTLNPGLRTLNFQPSTNQLGTHRIRLQSQTRFSAMKYLTLILLLVVTSCASRPKPQVTVRPKPAPAVEPAESVQRGK